MQLKLGGYFPKHVAVLAPGVMEVCSVSSCVSKAPEGWIAHWLHNELGWFDSLELVQRVVPEDARDVRVFAYRLLGIRYRRGTEEAWSWPLPDLPPLSNNFRQLGFDAVSKTLEAGLGFECSPLSCCSLGAQHGANRYCLIDTLEMALELGREFSIAEPEPGPYYVAEVLERA